jgi:photosynthetic reaction center H subunit
METGAITGYIDVAQVTLYAFWVFFALLLFYIRQEDRREGYPLEADQSGAFNRDDWLFLPPAKTFLLPHGHGEVSVPNDKRDNADRPVPGAKIANFSGAPYVPTGDNPMLDSIGPGSWAMRSDTPDMAHDGKAKIVPLRVATDFKVAEGDINPVGTAGRRFRPGGGRHDQRHLGGPLRADAALSRSHHGSGRCPAPDPGADQFRRLPQDQGWRTHLLRACPQGRTVRLGARPQGCRQHHASRRRPVTAYFGSGLLYADPSRQEPLA